MKYQPSESTETHNSRLDRYLLRLALVGALLSIITGCSTIIDPGAGAAMPQGGPGYQPSNPAYAPPTSYAPSNPAYVAPPGYAPSAPTSAVTQGRTEAVTLVKVMDVENKAIIERSNGETWLIEYGAGVVSIWLYESKRALINSPGSFGGSGSSIILPDCNQKARIWNAERIQ